MSVNIEAILIGLFSVAHTPEQAEHAAKEVMRQHAHELAEKQRARADASAMMRSERMQGIAQGLRIGADLIDPTA